VSSPSPQDEFPDEKGRPGVPPRRAGTSQSQTWAWNRAKLADFVSAHGRLPRRTVGGHPSPPAERSLFYWLRAQRRRATRLTASQATSLERLPDFGWEPRLDQWHGRLSAYGTFVTVKGRSPRRRGSDPEEQSLARWYERQIALHRRDLLPYERIGPLMALRATRAGKHSSCAGGRCTSPIPCLLMRGAWRPRESTPLG
jgi:hypothetical protein